MKLTLGFSPCPNDTFIFDALVNQKIDAGGLGFDVVLEDVQTLNEWALQGKLDISKISYGVLPLVLHQYILLSSGGALGKGVGPLLITKNGAKNSDTINEMLIAIPGENTTAHLLFSLAFPNSKNKIFKVFNEIENALLNNEIDAGVIIHENRFTYQQKGLIKIMDLGEYWEKITAGPIPLGGIVAKQNLPIDIITKVNSLIQSSVEYAYEHHYKELSTFVKQHSLEMSESVMRQHIELYVNNYSINLGENGREAVMKLLEIYQQLHPEQNFSIENVFCNIR